MMPRCSHIGGGDGRWRKVIGRMPQQAPMGEAVAALNKLATERSANRCTLVKICNMNGDVVPVGA